MLAHQRIRQYLIGGRSFLGVYFEQRGDDSGEIVGVHCRNALEHAGADLFVEALKVSGNKGRSQCGHLVANASQGPHIAFWAVGLVFPYLRTGVVRSACLGLRHVLLEHLGDVEVAQLVDVVGSDEDVRALEVAVQDLPLVQRLEAEGHMHQGSPYFLLFVLAACLGVRLDSLENVAPLREFHDHTERSRVLIVEGLLVADDVVIVVGGEDANLVECVIALLLLHCPDLHLHPSSSTFFNAYSLPSASRFTRNTCPKAPSPSLEIT